MGNVINLMAGKRYGGVSDGWGSPHRQCRCDGDEGLERAFCPLRRRDLMGNKVVRVNRYNSYYISLSLSQIVINKTTNIITKGGKASVLIFITAC